VRYLSATAADGERLRAVLAGTSVLLVAACVALVAAAIAGIRVVRRTVEIHEPAAMPATTST